MAVNDPRRAPTITSVDGSFRSVQPGDLITADLFNQILAVVSSLDKRVAELETAAGGGFRPPAGSGFTIGDQFVDATIIDAFLGLDDEVIRSIRDFDDDRVKEIRNFVDERADLRPGGGTTSTL